VLLILAAHGLLTFLAEQVLTVGQLLEDEQEFEQLVVQLSLGFLAFMLGLLLLFWLLGKRGAFRRTVLIYLALAMFSLVLQLSDLVTTLGQRSEATGGAFALLGDAALTWGANVLTFAVWYWFLDQGGPDRRQSAEPGRPDFAFPQQTSELPGWEGWTPGLFDYLFVAFNTSTAFSPTDTVVLSAGAKILCMIQSGISLVIIAMLAARVVNMF
jgi:hypothetical protein